MAKSTVTDFQALATEFVFSETEAQEQAIITRAAHAIQTTASRTSTVSNWAQSIAQWMPGASAGSDAPVGGVRQTVDAADEDDVVVRAKALGFLAGTLRELDRHFLRDSQVDQLVLFFGKMFSLDHKAGVMPAALALRHLVQMKHFSPQRSSSILDDICQLGDDFHRQVTSTRHEIYSLLSLLLGDDEVRTHLRSQDSRSGELMAGLLQLCHQERDPGNLVVWFGVLRLFLLEYVETAELVGDIFGTYSPYFPVSMRSSTTPSGITIDDLKLALRGCFSASHLAAGKVIGFLVEKLDQGDAVSLLVKLDILRTIQSCLEDFPASAVAPHASRIWNSLKYEVRNGEAEEAISCTLNVIKALSTRLSPFPAREPGDSFLEDFLEVSSDECIRDLSDSVYARHSGFLLTNIAAGSREAFHFVAPRLLAALKGSVGRSTLPMHTRDLITVLNDILRVRRSLLSEESADDGDPELPKLMAHDTAIAAVLEEVYLPLWRRTSAGTQGSTQISVLQEITKGFGELIRQAAPGPGAEAAMLSSEEQSATILRTLLPCVVWPFHSPAPYPPHTFRDVARSAVLALQDVVAVYPPGFRLVVDEASFSILGRRIHTPTALPEEELRDVLTGQEVWENPRRQDLVMLKEMLSRLATIGLSSTQPPGKEAVARLEALTAALLRLLRLFLRSRAPFPVSMVVLSGIQSALFNFREACHRAGMIKDNGKQELAAGLTLRGTVGASQSAVENTPSISESRAATQPGPQVYDSDAQQVVGEYQQICLQIVIELYRWDATETFDASDAAPGGLGSDTTVRERSSGLVPPKSDLAPVSSAAAAAFWYQVSTMAAFALRDMTVARQQSSGLNHEPFRLFLQTPPRRTMFHSGLDDRLDVLSMGIFRGLSPSLVSTMLELGIVPVNLFDDFDRLDSLSDRALLARNSIASLVANKYTQGEPGTPSRKGWDDAIAFVNARLSGANSGMLTPAQFSRVVAFLAGALARLDPGAKAATDFLVSIPRFRSGREEMARSMGQMLLANENLDPESLAIVKPLYKQWVYTRIVRPLIAAAQPAGGESPDSKVSVIALLALLRHTPFAMYEEDAEPLTRVLVTAVTRLADWEDIAIVYELLTTMVEHNGQALKGHLDTVVDGATKAFRLATTAGGRKSGDASRAAAAACRRQIVRLLSRLPTCYEQRYLLHLSPSATRMLSTACGDSVRQIREAAQLARENWATVL